MVIGLLGMSCAGKTFWANKLSVAGFACIHVDDLIAERFSAELGQGAVSQEDIGSWMGMPYEPGYAERQARYLAYEAESLSTIVAHLAQRDSAAGDLVVDMGGSVIYLNDALLAQLRLHVCCVYLTITPQVRADMLESYLARPRALVWGDQFTPHPGEDHQATIARCYPELIAWREQRYLAWSHVAITYDLHRQPDLTAAAFLRHISTSVTQPPRAQQ